MGGSNGHFAREAYPLSTEDRVKSGHRSERRERVAKEVN